MLSMLGKIFSRKHFDSYFSWKIGIDISCKLSPQKTICMKCQTLFYEEEKKKKKILLWSEFAESAKDLYRFSCAPAVAVTVTEYIVYQVCNVGTLFMVIKIM